jgi:hypothetical protein
MSLQTDARDCLIAAIAERNNVDIPPDQMGTVKPSDPEIGAQDGFAWQQTLDLAADCLRSKGYPTREPTLDKANILVNKVLTASQMYLEELSRPAPPKAEEAALPNNVLLWGGAAVAAVSALALAAHYARRKR